MTWWRRLRKNLRRVVKRYRRFATLRVGGYYGRFRVRRGAIARRLASENPVESEQLETFLEALRPDDTVYELGGHIGTWSVFLGLATPEGELHVFEPEPYNRSELNANLSLNGLDRVQVHALAASDAEGTASLNVVARPGDGKHSLVDDEHHYDSIEVQTVRLDEFAARPDVRPPTAVKIDVEGAEAAVVAGLEKTLQAHVPRVLFIEIHPAPGLEQSQERMHRQLERAGYAVVRSWQRGGEVQRLYRRTG